MTGVAFFTDKTGEPRSNEEIAEAIQAVRKELVGGKPASIMVYYMTISDGLTELLARRKQDD